MNEFQPFAFVLMPFDEKFSDVYRFGIKEAASAQGIIAERVDEQIYKEGILERIYNQINASDLIIADMTDKNPNVYYEVGYAHAKEKLCILLTSNAEDIPFDLKHRRHIIYDGSIGYLKNQLSMELQWAKKQINNVRLSHISVSIKECAGTLEKTKYSDTGYVDIVIDLNNNSESDSPELEAAYFHCGSGWTLYQDGKECPSTQSDIPPFLVRHFLTLPIRRLRRSGWTQIKFSSKKLLARSLKGDELKDIYKISGRSIFRLVTADGEFDFELPIDVDVSEIPF